MKKSYLFKMTIVSALLVSFLVIAGCNSGGGDAVFLPPVKAAPLPTDPNLIMRIKAQILSDTGTPVTGDLTVADLQSLTTLNAQTYSFLPADQIVSLSGLG